mmetsp:Transcript_7686/g.19133  ORF Transcript_7686/g.19133 Transcript_7686/m.19133 type:complete len:115 (+) Transcript_7686:467-811(+)
MFQQFGRLTANQRVWSAIGGVIVAGTAFKITYFQYCRDAMLKEGAKSHLNATEHYREAREFAKWSAEDRAKKRAELPPLTPEQREQMRNYIRIMQEYHAFNPDSDLDPVTGKPR